MKFIDLKNQKINMLTVVKRLPSEKRRTYWLCKCECGNYKKILSQHLIQKKIYSCGCTRKPVNRKTKYGNYNKRIYSIWNCMKSRCYREKDIEYQNYGGRGIKICDEWKNNFILFHNWALDNGYDENLTIDRIDVNGNYEPNNCRWITKRENNLNRRGIILVDFGGKKICLKDYCKITNICYDTALRKHKKGINIYK